MKKITILALTIVLLALAFTGCSGYKVDAGILPNIGGTVWVYSTTIDGVPYRGTISFGKRTDFATVKGIVTQTAPVDLVRHFTGTLDRYTLKINTIGTGGTTGIKFEGTFNRFDRWHNAVEINGKISHSDDIGASPIDWQEGVWDAILSSQ